MQMFQTVFWEKFLGNVVLAILLVRLPSADLQKQLDIKMRI